MKFMNESLYFLYEHPERDYHMRWEPGKELYVSTDNKCV